MTIRMKQFKESLAIYGTDVNSWPEDVRPMGVEALERFPEARTLLAEEQRFEGILRQRKLEAPSFGFAERIASAASSERKDARGGFGSFFLELFGEFTLFKPTRTAVCFSILVVLILGFSVGFIDSRQNLPAESLQKDLQEQFYDEGDVL